MGADIVAAEGQSIGNALNFGGPYVGLFATREQIRAPDAGPAGRPDRRCRRPARLGADPVDPRAAHPPREGDQQHLHQFRAVRARLHHPSGAARRGRADPAGAAQPRRRGRRSPSGSPQCPACSSSTGSFFNEFTLRLPRPAAPVVEALAERGILAGVPVSRFYPGPRRSRRLLLVAATETVTEDDIDRLAPGSDGGAAMNGWSQALSAAIRPRRGRPVETFTGNRGLQIEEKLIFEQDSPGRLRRRPARAAAGRVRLGGLERQGADRPARASASRR